MSITVVGENISRRRFMSYLAASAVPFVLPLSKSIAQGNDSDRPNILFIMADEWRAQATGYSSNTSVHTPALDGLAAQSVNFVNACSNQPVCCPFRSSLFTGQYPLTHGVFLNDEELKPTGITLGQAFANAGYQTGWIGKWNVYGSPQGRYERRTAFIPPEYHFGFQYWKACECTHNYYNSIYYEGDDPTPKYWPGYDAIAQTDDACSFIEERSKTSEPFFLGLSWGPPHSPFNNAPENYQSFYSEREIQLRPNVPEQNRERAIRDLRGYYSHISALDDCVARVLSTLNSSGIADNTIVVFTSDHGDMMGSQGLSSGMKHVPWDETIRIPFLVRYPKKLGTEGKLIQTVLGAPDIMPTLLGLADLRIPDGVQGTDHSRLCQGETPPDDSNTLLQFPVAFGVMRNAGFTEYRGLRTERYTYARRLTGPWLLYDNQADPYQMQNLCGLDEYKDLQAGLDRALDARLEELEDEFLPGEEYIRQFGYEHNREIGSGRPGQMPQRQQRGRGGQTPQQAPSAQDTNS